MDLRKRPDFEQMTKKLGPQHTKTLLKLLEDHESAGKSIPSFKKIESIPGVKSKQDSKPMNARRAHHEKVMSVMKKYGSLGGFPSIPGLGGLPSILKVHIGDNISGEEKKALGPGAVAPPSPHGAPPPVKGFAEHPKPAEPVKPAPAAPAAAPAMPHVGHPAADAGSGDDDDDAGAGAGAVVAPPVGPDAEMKKITAEELTEEVVKGDSSLSEEEKIDKFEDYAKQQDIKSQHGTKAAARQTYLFAKNYANNDRFIPYENAGKKTLDANNVILYQRRGRKSSDKAGDYHQVEFELVGNPDAEMVKTIGNKQYDVHYGVSFKERDKKHDYVIYHKDSFKGGNPPQKLKLG